MRKVVVKFGGTSVGDGQRIRLAANSVYEESKRGSQIVVVVSAMGHTTDEIIEVARVSTGGKLSAEELDDIMAMGERTSARIFSSALRSLGANSIYVDPSCEEWPIITNSNFGQADIDLAETEIRVKKYILPLLAKGVIPVVCGFLGVDKQGRITTIGRGGSDITAFVLGKCIKADEVIIVTDVEGVMSADPRKVENAKLLREISVEELRDLARYGAQVMHPRAMNYKDPKIDAKVIHFRHGNLLAGGTTITGPKGEGMSVELYEKPLAMLTVVGEQMQLTPGVLAKAVGPLAEAKINIFGVAVGPRSFSIYVADRDARRGLKLLHEVVANNKIMKSVTVENNIAMITAESEKFIETPGMVAKLTEPLAREKINIIEILSSRATITFFVNWNDREHVVKLLKKVMEEVR
jgi:aspartate kinase